MTAGLHRPLVSQRVMKHYAVPRKLLLILSVVTVGALWYTNPLWAQPESQALNCELRIVWGGDVPRSYSGSITVSDGSISVVRQLSLQEDAINAVQNDSRQSLVLLPRSPSSFGGVDIAVRGTNSTHLKLQLEDPYAKESKEFDIPLSDLLHGSWVKMLDERGHRLAIERQLHDIIRVTSEVGSPIFDAGQNWPIVVEGRHSGRAAGQYALDFRFVRNGHVIGEPHREQVTLDAAGGFAPISLELPTPSDEGAYLLEIELHQRNYLKSLVASAPPLLRRVELIVFDRHSAAEHLDDWKTVASIDPLRASKPGSLAWLTSFDILTPLGISNGRNIADKLQPYNPLAGTLNQPMSHGSLGSRRIHISEDATDMECLTLEPGAWLAIPLHDLQPDRMHRIRLRVPTDQSMELGASIAQLNSRGEFSPLTLDSGVIVTPRQAREPGGLSEHSISFWPRAERTYILLSNTSPQRAASVWDLKVDQSATSTAQQDSDRLATSDIHPSIRMIGFHLAKPLLADSVLARRDRDPVIGRELESWQTWQQSIERICQYMRARGTNTLMLTGFSDGGAVFPSERLGPTRRYDSGTFFSDGRCTEIKDAIELLLRHFDREGFRLILELDLGSELPNLSRFENGNDSDALLQQPISETHIEPLQNRKRYNPLNSRVQEELLAIVREIVERYRDHRSFAGISIQLDRRSHLTFAGDRWGYDAQTLQAFEQAKQIKLPEREELDSVFSGPARLTYLDWRAAELTKLYQRLGEVVWSAEDQRKLYLNAARLWDEFPSDTHFFSPESIVRSPHEFLLASGIDTERLAASEKIELMRGSIAADSDSVNARDWILLESRERGLIEANSEPNSSAIVLQNPIRHELSDFSKLSGSGKRWIYPTFTQPHASARKRLVEQIYHADPLLLVAGGWLPFSGEEEARDSLVRVLREFPPVSLEQVALREKDTNLSVRMGVYEGKTYLQLVNNASWTENLSIGYQFAGPSEAASATEPKVRVLGDRQVDLTSSSSTSADLRRWSFSIQPYEIIGIEIADPSFTLTSFQHAPEEGTKESIASELSELEALITQSADIAQQSLLGNVEGEFERWSEDGTPIGWSVSTLPQVSIGPSSELPHSGKSSLLIENRNPTPVSAWAQSRAIAAPATGRVAVQAWLRVPAVSEPVTVKLAVVCRTRLGDRIERSVTLGRKSSDKSDADAALPIDWGRKPAILYVGDISDTDIAELSVAIELIGPGKVWVDDVQVFQSLLQPDERNHVRGQLLGVKQELEANNLFPAEQLLDSNWGRYLVRLGAQQNRQLRSASNSNPAQMTPLPGPARRENWPNSSPSFRQFRETLRERWRR